MYTVCIIDSYHRRSLALTTYIASSVAKLAGLFRTQVKVKLVVDILLDFTNQPRFTKLTIALGHISTINGYVLFANIRICNCVFSVFNDASSDLSVAAVEQDSSLFKGLAIDVCQVSTYMAIVIPLNPELRVRLD